MTSHKCWLTGFAFLSAFASMAMAQVGFQPPPEVKLTTRYSLDPAAIWAEVPVDKESIEKNREKLEQAVKDARTPLDQARTRIALANWWLAVPTAQPATRWLLNMASEKDCKVLAEAATAAQKNIQEARLLLKKIPTTASAPASQEAGASNEAAQSRQKLESAIETLTPFIATLATALPVADESTQKSRMSAAARSFASVREVANPDLAACALMWQAFTWNMAGREGRSTVSLPKATAKPEQPSYDFLNRLIRCQILADNGHYAAAVAMALRVRNSCEEWFPTESPEQLRARERLAALVQCSIGSNWMAALRRDKFPVNADRLEALLIQVQDTVFAGLKPPIAVYTLDQAIPILPLPSGNGSDSATQSQPAPTTKTAD